MKLVIVLILLSVLCAPVLIANSISEVGDIDNFEGGSENRSTLSADPFDIIEYNIIHGYAPYEPDKIPPHYYERNISFLKQNDTYIPSDDSSKAVVRFKYQNNTLIAYNVSLIPPKLDEVSSIREDIKYQLIYSNTYSGLSNFVWFYLPPWFYRTNFFDCSEMTAYLEHELELYGFDAKICVSHDFAGTGIGHAWIKVVLHDSNGRQEVYFIEPTLLNATHTYSWGGALIDCDIDWGTMKPNCGKPYLTDYEKVIIPEDGNYNVSAKVSALFGQDYFENFRLHYDKVENYKKCDRIYEDIYEACSNESIEEFNWWATLNEAEEDGFKEASSRNVFNPALIVWTDWSIWTCWCT